MVGVALLLAGCTPDYGMHWHEYTTVHETTEYVGTLDVVTGVVPPQELDVLFVVDTSGSMAGELHVLTSLASDLVSALESPPFTDLDWRVAAIPAAPAQTVARYADRHASTALDAAVASVLAVDTAHWYAEAGIQAALDSLVWDAAFHRPTAHALVVWLSDEDDQGAISAATWRASRAQLKASPLSLTSAAVVHVDGACRSGSESVGHEYVAAADLAISICDPSQWLDALAPAADVVPDTGRVWLLPHTPLYPAVDHVDVRVDGAPVGWTWDATRNAVELDAMPSAGSTVTIAYVW